MGKYIKKILISFNVICLYVFALALLGDESQFQNAELNTFMVPKYNLKTKKLEYILRGKKAKTVGTDIKIIDAKLEVIGDDGKSIKIVVTTPEAVYNKIANNIKGDKEVHYRSLQMDADGVGFAANILNKKLHIDKNVELVIYQKGRKKETEKISLINPDKSDHKEAFEKIKNINLDMTAEADSKTMTKVVVPETQVETDTEVFPDTGIVEPDRLISPETGTADDADTN
ncbi:MAG: hypothetical protein K9M56_09495 [Victivallales bacterium]|nr:hypothetical protein [Victivallales bacterium]